MSQSKIYIPNKGAHDFSKATQYGELVYLSTGKVPLNSIGAIYRTFEPVIEKSQPEDYILICGPTTLNVILGSLFSFKHHRLNLLIWNIGKDGDGSYMKRNLVFNPCTGDTAELKRLINLGHDPKQAESIVRGERL